MNDWQKQAQRLIILGVINENNYRKSATEAEISTQTGSIRCVERCLSQFLTRELFFRVVDFFQKLEPNRYNFLESRTEDDIKKKVVAVFKEFEENLLDYNHRFQSVLSGQIMADAIKDILHLQETFANDKSL